MKKEKRYEILIGALELNLTIEEIKESQKTIVEFLNRNLIEKLKKEGKTK